MDTLLPLNYLQYFLLSSSRHGPKLSNILKLCMMFNLCFRLHCVLMEIIKFKYVWLVSYSAA